MSTLIDHAETLEQIVRELEKSENEACKQVTSVEKLQTDSLNEKQHTENALSELSTQLTKLTSSFNRLKEETIKRLLTFGVHEIPESNVEQLLNELKERLNAWNEKQKLLATIEKQVFELNGELKSLEAVIDNQKITLTEKQDIFKKINLEYQSISEDRKNIFGTKNTDIEEAELEKAVSDAESLEKLALDTKDKVKRLVDDAKVRIGSLKEQILKRTPQLKGVEKEFNDALKNSSFEDEKTYLANSLSAGERNLLSNQANKLDTNKANLELKLTDRKERLLIEKNKKITESSVHELKPALLELEGNQHQVRERVTTLTIELRNQRINKEKLQEKQALVETQKIECNRLEKLHSLIGSSDGKKYRNFAQGLTFELMVSHANKQLENKGRATS